MPDRVPPSWKEMIADDGDMPHIQTFRKQERTGWLPGGLIVVEKLENTLDPRLKLRKPEPENKDRLDVRGIKPELQNSGIK